MTDREMKEYLKGLINKYDYYDPVKDRTEALQFAKIKNNTLLDIGTGKGHLAILAAKDFNCNVTTIDKSKESIKTAKENAKKENVLSKIDFKLNDAAHLSFKDNSFDTVVSFNTLHHSKYNYKEIIKEMFRVAKNKVIVTELNDTGVRIFDEYIYPKKNHKDMAIDLEELQNILKQHSNVNRFDRKLMCTFACDKHKEV